MKIYALNSYTNQNHSINKSKLRQNPIPEQNQPAFKGAQGQAIGGVCGSILLGTTATYLATMLTSSSLLLGITAAGSYVLGLLLGSNIGDKIEGDDHFE